jgi:ketosteroid isomerase-like protein
MSKSRLVLFGIILILIVGGLAYVGSRNQVTPTPTNTVSITPTPTVIPTVTPTIPMNDSYAIEQLVSNYHESARAKSVDGIMELFKEDATLTINSIDTLKFSGKNPIRGYYSYILGNVEGSVDLKVLESSITLKGSMATVTCKVIDSGKSGSEFFELIKVKGMWKISALTNFVLY